MLMRLLSKIILGLILLVGAVAFGVKVYLHLRPYYDEAQAVDLSKFREYAHQDAIALEKVPRHMIDAVVAAEDPQFFESEGPSTISQQLARTNHVRSYRGMLVNVFLAYRIVRNFSKAEIMEMYLNRTYFGSGYYGINVASKGYFGKAASEISIGQAATLAGLIRSPDALSPINHPEACKAARDHVLARMEEQKLITEETKDRLVALPVR